VCRHRLLSNFVHLNRISAHRPGPPDHGPSGSRSGPCGSCRPSAACCCSGVPPLSSTKGSWACGATGDSGMSSSSHSNWRRFTSSGTSSCCGSISRFHLSSGRSLSRSGRDDRVRPLRGPAAVGADRSQAAGPDLPSQRRIRRLEAQSLKLVEQGDAPQMRILDQPRRDVVEERRTGRRHADAPPVPACRSGSPGTVLRSLPTWRAIAVSVQPCRRSAWISTSSSRVIMSTGSPSNSWCVVRDHQRRSRPAPRGGATPAGNFGERQWGISVSAITICCLGRGAGQRSSSRQHRAFLRFRCGRSRGPTWRPRRGFGRRVFA
jgi:hypothetical protein